MICPSGCGHVIINSSDGLPVDNNDDHARFNVFYVSNFICTELDVVENLGWFSDKTQGLIDGGKVGTVLPRDFEDRIDWKWGERFSPRH